MTTLDLSPTYAALYEAALFTLVEVDHGLHGDVGARARALVADEADRLKQQAFGSNA